MHSFSKDNDDDIGNTPKLPLDIELLNREPVRKTQLHKDVSDYVTDLVNRGWIKKSKSPYSSPMVCIRKTDMSLRLCIDYMALNQKSVKTRQPIPRIHDSLKGNEWFSILDQGKAYHQGYVKPECQHYTAFITPWGNMNGCVYHLDYPELRELFSSSLKRLLLNTGVNCDFRILMMS